MKLILKSIISCSLICSLYPQLSAAEKMNDERRKHTFSLGYVFTDVSGGVKERYRSKDIGHANNFMDGFSWQDGINLKYRYEYSNIWGGLISSTGTSKKASGKGASREMQYNSIMVGPTFRLNDYLSTYALLGVSKGEYSLSDGRNRYGESKHGFASGIGVQINPISSLAIDLGYEFSKINYNDNLSGKYNSWVVGVGYRF